MKKTIYYLSLMIWIIILAMSCNEDDDNSAPAPEFLLTKVLSDGIPTIELTYDNDRKLRRLNMYQDNELSAYVLYEYDENGIQQLLRYNPDHDLVIRSEVTLDDLGRIIEREDYSTFGNFKQVVSSTIFAYDPNGLLKSSSNGNLYYPEFTLEELTYDENNRPIKRSVTTYPNQVDEYVSAETEFTPGDKTIYGHWTDYVFLLSLANVDGNIEKMFNLNTHETSWLKNGNIKSEDNTVATDQEFNSDGYLTRQVLTHEDLLNSEPDVVQVMTYEYTQ